MKTLNRVQRDFRNVTGGGDHRLAYFARGGSHVVTHYLPAGETTGDLPEVYRHDTVEAARRTWGRIQTALTARGYKAAR